MDSRLAASKRRDDKEENAVVREREEEEEEERKTYGASKAVSSKLLLPHLFGQGQRQYEITIKEQEKFQREMEV